MNYESLEYDEFGEPIVVQNDETYVPFQKSAEFYFQRFNWLRYSSDCAIELDFMEDNYLYYDEES